MRPFRSDAIAPLPHLQEFDERLESSRSPAPTRVIQEESHRAWSPIFQQRNNPLLVNEGADETNRYSRYADAVHGGTDCKITIADDERAFDHDLQALAALFEYPMVHGAAREPLTDAIVSLEISRQLRPGMAKQ